MNQASDIGRFICPPFLTGHRQWIAREAVAAILFFSSIAKVFGLWRTQFFDLPSLTEPTFEVLLASWLASGRAVPWAIRSTLAVFTVFAVVSLNRIRSASSSCGCFGSIEVPPIRAFILDLLVLAALALQEDWMPHLSRSRRLVVGATVLVAGVGALWLVHSAPVPPA
jgi:hypothetical protein